MLLRPRFPSLRVLADVRARAAVGALVVTGAAATIAFTSMWLAASPGAAQTSSFPRFSLKPAFSVSVGPDSGLHAFVLHDLDLNGKLDLVTIDQPNQFLHVFLGNGDGTFTEKGTVEIAVPTAVAVADVGSPFSSAAQGDKDGIPDIIVGNDDGETHVFFGKGDGTFPPEEALNFDDAIDDYAVAGSIVGIALADFDNNGRVDIALVDDSDTVTFICNDHGNFGLCETDELDTDGDTAIKIVAGDFDGDSNPDVAVLNQGSMDISVMYGDGHGVFDENVTIVPNLSEGDGTPIDFGAALMDSDGATDLVVMTDFQDTDLTSALLLGLPSTNIPFDRKLFPADPDVNALALGDFNLDGAVDILVRQGGETSVQTTFFSGDGAGNINQGVAIGGTSGMARSRMIAAGNLGGDGLLDFISLAEDGTSMQVAINIKNGGPTDTPGGTPSTPTATISGSVAPTSTSTPTVPTITATATATPTPMPTANYGRCFIEPHSPHGTLAGIATGRLDGDGRPDIAVTDSANNAVYVIFNTADVQTQLRTCAMSMTDTPISPSALELAVGPSPGAVAAVDLERDGDVDLVVAESDGIVVLRSDGQGHFAREAPITVGSQPVAIIADYPNDPTNPAQRAPLDLNRDGRTDLVVANAGSSFLSILYGREGGGFDVTSRNIAGNANAVVAADFNQDGRVDLAAARGSGALMLIQSGLDGSGQSVFQSSSFGEGDRIVALSTGFFNADLAPDLLITRAGAVGQVYTFSGGSFLHAGDLSTGSGPTASGVGLFNDSDSSSDVVVASRGDNNLYFGFGDGGGGFRSPPVLPFEVSGEPVALSVVNIDADGMQDVVLANNDGTITVLLSSVPPPTPTPTATYTASVTPTATASGSPTDTPTVTATFTMTPAGTLTATATSSRTATPSPNATLKPGTFGLSSCSIGDPPGRPPVGMTAVLAVLAFASWWRRRSANPVADGERD